MDFHRWVNITFFFWPTGIWVSFLLYLSRTYTEWRTKVCLPLWASRWSKQGWTFSFSHYTALSHPKEDALLNCSASFPFAFANLEHSDWHDFQHARRGPQTITVSFPQICLFLTLCVGSNSVLLVFTKIVSQKTHAFVCVLDLRKTEPTYIFAACFGRERKVRLWQQCVRPPCHSAMEDCYSHNVIAIYSDNKQTKEHYSQLTWAESNH